MTLLQNQKGLIIITMIVSTAISIVACNEKTEDSNRIETVVSTVTEDKIAQLQNEAQEGDPDAQYELAYHYENGLGVPKNETKALELYQQAADQGHSAAQDNLDAISKAK